MFCVPIIAKDTEEAIKKMNLASAQADIVEIRLDMMESFELKPIIMSSVKPVLATYRSEKQGGRGKDDSDMAADYLISAINAGADFIDVELSMDKSPRERIIDAKGKAKIIVSTHVNDMTPSGEGLKRIYNKGITVGGDIIKIVTMASIWEDNFRVLELIPEAREEGVEIIAFCVGPLGRMSRIFSLLMGGYMTFASLETGQQSADGQMPVAETKRLVEFFMP
jgi:3-dehydroquinate dehydratase type I